MPQTITTSQPEISILRHAFDSDAEQSLYILDCIVTLVNNQVTLNPSPSWFRWRPVEKSPLSDRARLDLEMLVRAYDAADAGVNNFEVQATVSDTQETAVCSWFITIDRPVTAKTIVHFNLQSYGSGPLLTAYDTGTGNELQNTIAPGFNVTGDPYSDWAMSAHNAGPTETIYYEDYGLNYTGGIKAYNPLTNGFFRIWDAPYSTTTAYRGVGIDAASGRAWVLDNAGLFSTVPLDGSGTLTPQFSVDLSGAYRLGGDPRVDVDESASVLYLALLEDTAGGTWHRVLKFGLDGSGPEVLFAENSNGFIDDLKADRARGGAFVTFSSSGYGLLYNPGSGTAWDLIDERLDNTAFIAVDNSSTDGLVYGTTYDDPFGSAQAALWSLPRTGGGRQQIWSGNSSVGYLALL